MPSLCIPVVCLMVQGKRIDALAAHPGTAKTAIWDKMDKEKIEGVAFDLTAKVVWRRCYQNAMLNARLQHSAIVCCDREHRVSHTCQH